MLLYIFTYLVPIHLHCNEKFEVFFKTTLFFAEELKKCMYYFFYQTKSVFYEFDFTFFRNWQILMLSYNTNILLLFHFSLIIYLQLILNIFKISLQNSCLLLFQLIYQEENQMYLKYFNLTYQLCHLWFWVQLLFQYYYNYFDGIL